MKSIQELYDEVINSEELKKEFLAAAKAGQQEAFLRGHGCYATLDDVAQFLIAKNEQDAPLSMGELEKSAGGGCSRQSGGEIFMSVVTVGVGCGITAIVSASLDTHHVGRQNESEGYFCEANK